ncbi:MAG: choice-of-anchor D domain-containing protein, partial [Acidobacteriia bacterium]|nr:choice-of-anchor D domain-containing protein [Terriglobia bacterium]
SIAASGDFTQTNTCGVSVAPGRNCTVAVTFTPAAAGNRTGALTITDNAAGSPHRATLSGTGVTPAQLSLSPASLTFAGQNVGTPSAVQRITLSNPGGMALSIASIAATGDFAQTNTCGSSVAAGGNCTLSVTFTPSTAGNRTGALTIADGAAGSPHRVALSGTGVAVPQLSLSPSSLTFANQNVGTASAMQRVTLSNPGSAALSIASISIAGDFSQANTCGGSIAPGRNCTISVTFLPRAAGSRTGTLTINDTAAGSPHRLAVSGTGVVRH